jgi:hypothetical protein
MVTARDNIIENEKVKIKVFNECKMRYKEKERSISEKYG